MKGIPFKRETLQDVHDNSDNGVIVGSIQWDEFRYLDTETGGQNNTLIGELCGFTNTGVNNTGVGERALENLLGGGANTGLGMRALRNVTTGSFNTGIGAEALHGITTTNDNVAVGYRTLRETTGTGNFGMGTNALRFNTQSYNMAIGDRVMYSNINGVNNTAAGYQAGYYNLGSSNVFLGRRAGFNETGSSTLYIETSERSDPLIYGNFSTRDIKINGSLENTQSVRHSAIETVTASSDTLGDTNFIVLCDCSSNAITINLPTAVGNEGLTYKIKKIDSSSNVATIDGNGTEEIDGALTMDLEYQHEVVELVSDGANWWII